MAKMWTPCLMLLLAVTACSGQLWLNCSSMSQDNPIKLYTLNTLNSNLNTLRIRMESRQTVVLRMEICCNVTSESLQSCSSCDNGTVECDRLSHEKLTLHMDTCNTSANDVIWCEPGQLTTPVGASPTASKPALTTLLSSTIVFSQTTGMSSMPDSFTTINDVTSTPAANSSEEFVNGNDTARYTTEITLVSVTENLTTNYVDTSTAPAQQDEAHQLKNLYTFLIVAGVLFALVILLVCFFFCRKKRDKLSISHVDYPLEYWQDKEYIEGVVEKSYCPTAASLTINPVYETDKGQASTASTQRYRKKEDSLTRGSNQQKKASDHLRRSNATRQRPNGSSDTPRKVKHDHAENYVATAAGSNFYEYNMPARAEQRTNLDDDEEVDLGNPGPAYTPGNDGTSSFRPASREGRRKRRAPSGPGSRHSDRESEGERADHEVYAISYKNRLQKNLDDWSAEESDV